MAHRGSPGLGRASTMPAIGTSRSSDSNQGNSSSSVTATLNRHQSAGPSSQPLTGLSVRSNGSVPTGFPLTLSEDGFVVISHDRSVQERLDRLGIPWGAQYELARGVTRGWWRWSEVTMERLKKLLPDTADNQTRIASPSRVVDVMLGREPASRRLELW